MLCKKCGKEIADTAKFCGYCGEKVEEATINVNSDYSWINDTQPRNVSENSEFKPLTSFGEENKTTIDNSFSVISNDLGEIRPFTDVPTNFAETINNDFDSFKSFDNEQKIQKEDEIFNQRFDDIKPFTSFNEQGEVKSVQDIPKENNEDVSIFSANLEDNNFNTEVVEPKEEPKEEPKIQQQNVEETIKVEPSVIKDNFKIDKLEEKIENNKLEEQNKSKNSGLKIIIVILAIAILGLGGFVAYDKFFTVNNDTDKEESNKKDNDVQVKENKMTETEALELVTEKYSSIYGETFNTMYYNLITNNDSTTLSTLFTENAINKLKLNKEYTTGLFGTTNQTVRNLEIVSVTDDYIVATGKNETDPYNYYITFKNVNNEWFIDMFE